MEASFGSAHVSEHSLDLLPRPGHYLTPAGPGCDLSRGNHELRTGVCRWCLRSLVCHLLPPPGRLNNSLQFLSGRAKACSYCCCCGCSVNIAKSLVFIIVENKSLPCVSLATSFEDVASGGCWFHRRRKSAFTSPGWNQTEDLERRKASPLVLLLLLLSEAASAE